jgi:hypothetical protein
MVHTPGDKPDTVTDGPEDGTVAMPVLLDHHLNVLPGNTTPISFFAVAANVPELPLNTFNVAGDT